MEPFFTTQSLTLPAANIPAAGGGGDTSDLSLFAIFVVYDNRRYIFRYAYPTQEQANSVLGNCRYYFGRPISIGADLANNYWRFYSRPKLRYCQRTSQRNSYYIAQE